MPAKNRTTSESFGSTAAKLCEIRWDETFVQDAISGETFTYGDFWSAALNCADALATNKIQSGDTISLVLNNTTGTLILYMAALLSGVRIALIDPEKGASDIQTILKQIETKITISDIASPAFGRTVIPSNVLLSSSKRKREKSHVIKALRAIHDTGKFLVTFTSGSTGIPKGVEHSIRNLLLTSLSFGERFGFGPEHAFYHHLPMTYVAGVLNSFILPLVHGS